MPRSIIVEHAAVLLGVSRRTIYYRIREGRLRTVRIGVSQRVLLDSIEALRDEMAAKGPGAAASDTNLSGKSPAP